MPRMVLELLTSWGTSFGYGPAKEDWRLVPLYLMWCIWREQNAQQFEDVETSMVELRKHLLNMLYIWIASHHNLNVFTYADFFFKNKNYFLFAPLLGAHILHVYYGYAHLCFINELTLPIKKKTMDRDVLPTKVTWQES
jgi:hypothetical protein